MCRRFDSGPVHCETSAIPGDSTGFDGGLMAGRGARKRRATKSATKPSRIWPLRPIESRPRGIGSPLGICAHVDPQRGLYRFLPHQFHQLGRLSRAARRSPKARRRSWAEAYFTFSGFFGST